jgi:hypothetical protein
MTTSPRPIVQISLDLTTIEEALDHAHKAVRAGVDRGSNRNVPELALLLR